MQSSTTVTSYCRYDGTLVEQDPDDTRVTQEGGEHERSVARRVRLIDVIGPVRSMYVL